jgi:hypothetical protein
MGKVINFDDYFIKSRDMTVRQIRGQRAYARFKADHYRRMQERDSKRKRETPPES